MKSHVEVKRRQPTPPVLDWNSDWTDNAFHLRQTEACAAPLICEADMNFECNLLRMPEMFIFFFIYRGEEIYMNRFGLFGIFLPLEISSSGFLFFVASSPAEWCGFLNSPSFVFDVIDLSIYLSNYQFIYLLIWPPVCVKTKICLRI